MARGESKGDSCSIGEKPLRRQATQQLPQTADNNIEKVYDRNMGEKDILFGRGNSFRRRASNRHLLNFVDIFKDHYFASGPFERQQIVRRIVEMLQNDGYSFWKQQRRGYLPRTVPVVIENSDEMESEDTEERPNPDTRSLWTEMSPLEVQRRVAQFFQKPASSLDWRQQHDHHHQQRVAALHQAISTAIDVQSPPSAENYEIAALDKAITSAIDASSLAEAIRDCPSPESTLPLSTSSSLSAFDPVISLSESEHDDPLILESSLLSVSPGSSPTMEHQLQESAKEVAPTYNEKEFAEMLTSISPVINNEKAEAEPFVTPTIPEGNDVSPEDDIIWSSGTQQIRLLESMESSIVPVQSISLFSDVQQVAFEKKTEAFVASRKENSNGQLSTTIGYTQQVVGNLTILRPIVLLPE